MKKTNLNPTIFFLAAALASASMWFYVDRILVSHQVADAAAHDRPRGNLSDLYPRWLGARELLLHGRNPYSDDLSIEIQQGYYGRPLDPNRPGDPKDRQSFAYPVYVVFVLAPLVGFSFHHVQIFFHWLLMALTAASVWLWLRAISWRVPALAASAIALLTLGSVPAVQGIKLQQLSLLVAALVAGAAACVAGDLLLLSGALLAFATIKPQLAWILSAWLLLWSVSDWRRRKMFVYSFGPVLALLLLGGEILLPHWWRMFAAGLGQYHAYTQNQSVLEVLLNQILGGSADNKFSHIGGQLLCGVAVLACVPLFWKFRREPANSVPFAFALALALALTVLVVPMYAPYNQVLLLPAILLLVRHRVGLLSRSPAMRLGYRLTGLTILWQWVASLGLTVIYFVSTRIAIAGWRWPFFATLALPVCVFVMLFFLAQGEAFA
jgi:hypothetical protein